jgi:hypothetical protein
MNFSYYPELDLLSGKTGCLLSLCINSDAPNPQWYFKIAVQSGGDTTPCAILPLNIQIFAAYLQGCVPLGRMIPQWYEFHPAVNAAWESHPQEMKAQGINELLDQFDWWQKQGSFLELNSTEANLPAPVITLLNSEGDILVGTVYNDTSYIGVRIENDNSMAYFPVDFYYLDEYIQGKYLIPDILPAVHEYYSFNLTYKAARSRSRKPKPQEIARKMLALSGSQSVRDMKDIASLLLSN